MNSRRERVVVGYDGSLPAGVAVDWAAGEAGRRGVPLTVLYAADATVMVPAALRVTDEGVERARKTATAVEVEAGTQVARPAAALVGASDEADLVVVGSRGHGEMTGALLGSVAFAVTAHARCPVVVVRTGAPASPGPDRSVVVGVDAWPASERAVAFAAGVAARTSARLVVVSACPAASREGGAPALHRRLEAEGAVASERAARQAGLDASEAAATAAREEYAGLDVRPRVLDGRPARVLAETGQGAGLLVVGARGEGGFAGLRLGSIAHAVLHDAPCPVAVVRGRDDAP